MNFKQSLDKYLTTPPDDGFTDYVEAVIESFTEEFVDTNEVWIIDETEQIDKWLNKLFDNNYEIKLSAMIIERAFKLYRL